MRDYIVGRFLRATPQGSRYPETRRGLCARTTAEGEQPVSAFSAIAYPFLPWAAALPVRGRCPFRLRPLLLEWKQTSTGRLRRPQMRTMLLEMDYLNPEPKGQECAVWCCRTCTCRQQHVRAS